MCSWLKPLFKKEWQLYRQPHYWQLILLGTYYVSSSIREPSHLIHTIAHEVDIFLIATSVMWKQGTERLGSCLSSKGQGIGTTCMWSGHLDLLMTEFHAQALCYGTCLGFILSLGSLDDQGLKLRSQSFPHLCIIHCGISSLTHSCIWWTVTEQTSTKGWISGRYRGVCWSGQRISFTQLAVYMAERL